MSVNFINPYAPQNPIAALAAALAKKEGAAAGSGSDLERELLKMQLKPLMNTATDTSPVQHWTQGAARLAHALVATQQMNKAVEGDQAQSAALGRELFGGGVPTGAPSAVPAPAPTAGASPPPDKQAFIESLLPHAMEASQKTGIDPRIVMAQAALETGWGKSAPGNNFFGIKSHGQPGGNVLPTKEFGPNGQYATQDSFRAYPDMKSSAMGYADFINQNPRYGELKKAQGLPAQIDALQRSGYATDPNYGQKVAQIAQGLPAPQQAGMQNAPGVASLGGAAPQAPAVSNAMPPAGPQLAQAQAPATARATPQVPPEILEKARRLWGMGSRGQAMAQQLMAPYMKPVVPEYQKLNDEELFEKHSGATKPAGSGYKPLVDAQERARFGIPPDDKRPYQLGPGNKLVNPPAESRVSIDQRGESEFSKESAKSQVKRFNDIVESGFSAKSMRADLETLRDLRSRFDTGKIAEMKTALGPYAEALGVKVDNLGEMQAFDAIVAKLAPRMRPTGSGATSDYEMQQYLKSLPTLGKTPEGNAIIENTMEALQQHQEKAAEIASMAMNRELSPKEADKMLRELPDPMTAWKDFKKKQNADSSDQPVRKYNPATGRIE